MLSAPLCARSLTSSAAFSEVEFTYVVVREAPFTSKVVLVLKFVPVTLSVAAGFPAGKLEGERLLTPGTGLFTVKVVTTEGRPLGFATVTNGVPATAIEPAGMAACNTVELTNADETTLELNVTTEPAVKPDPVNVSVKPGPPGSSAGRNKAANHRLCTRRKDRQQRACRRASSDCGWVRHGNIDRALTRNIAGGDRDGELCGADKCRCPGEAIEIHG